MSREEELKARLASDSGDPAFAELSDLYMAEGKVGEALTTLLSGLSANPGYHVGRLVLARLFAHLGYAPFAVRELVTLRQQRPECESIRRLLEAISPGSSKLSNDSWEDSARQLSQDGETGGAERVESPERRQNSAPSASIEETLAEGEFDFDILSDLAEDKEGSKEH